MSTGKVNDFLVSFSVDVLFKSEEVAIKFLEKHTRIRTLYTESDEGELVKVDVEQAEVQEMIDLSEDEE